MLLAGCHIPANSPLSGIAQLSPAGMPQTNVLPPAAMLQHPGPGVEGPGPGIITPASYDAALVANGLEQGVRLTGGTEDNCYGTYGPHGSGGMPLYGNSAAVGPGMVSPIASSQMIHGA